MAPSYPLEVTIEQMGDQRRSERERGRKRDRQRVRESEGQERVRRGEGLV